MSVPSYNFKITPELVWAVVVTVVGIVATTVATQGEVAPTDWRVWLGALAAGVIRAVIGLLLDKTAPAPAPEEPANG